MPAEEFTKKARTAAQKRQWQHVYDRAKKAGEPAKRAIMMANAAVRDHPSRKKA